MKPVCLTAAIGLWLFAAPTDNVAKRFTPPPGFSRVTVTENSFAAWLQQLPLKPAGTHTLTYAGTIARTDDETAAVVDMSVGNRDLQQCADAVMRLRAEYLFQAQRFNEIAFHFSNGFRCDYNHYAAGYRFVNNHWALKAGKDDSYRNFLQNLDLVFTYAGTLSLEQDLYPVHNAQEIKAGDVFIHGGSPGHCFMVMDVVENSHHQKQFLLAQSFMPAQNIQVLQDKPGQYWFSVDKSTGIAYGELISAKYLRKFD